MSDVFIQWLIFYIDAFVELKNKLTLNAIFKRYIIKILFVLKRQPKFNNNFTVTLCLKLKSKFLKLYFLRLREMESIFK